MPAMTYTYRIETIHIPESPGMAQKDDEGRDVSGRRIVAVLGEGAPQVGGGGRRLTVLTEEDVPTRL